MKVGEVFYPTGELYFIGRYDETAVDKDGMPYKLYAGVKFYKDGTVYQEGGPQCMREGSTHVSWWLFEEIDLSSFVILED